MMKKPIPKLIAALAIASLTAALLVPATRAQDGPARRAGQALDNAGRNIRRGVENAITRGQISAQERELLVRLHNRIRWDKRLVNSLLQIEVQADGTAILRGSVADAAAKARAIDLAESTVGVTRVVDNLAVAGNVTVIEAEPAQPPRVPESAPARTIESTPATPAPSGTSTIIKP